VALIDLLKSIGIEPNGFIGHSVGELTCAYSDGTFTIEQTILISALRVRRILETKLIKRSMAAVGNLLNYIVIFQIIFLFILHNEFVNLGLSWEETKKKLPTDLVAACHNIKDSVTISGPPKVSVNSSKTIKLNEFLPKN